MKLKTIDDKVVNERPRSYGTNIIESSSQSFQLWLDLGIFKEISGSSWNNNLLPISKDDKSKSIKDKLERKQKKENLLEKKFNEKSFRFVIDSKQLNSILQNTNTCYLQTIDNLFHNLSKKIISTFNINNAFSTIEIEQCDKFKLSFTWNGHKDVYTRASQGLKSISAFYY